MFIDYLIVGAGLTGSVIARKLKDAGFSVLIVDRRNHVGGNVHDHYHPSGIRIHTYGPHYFRTSSESIWKFVNRFAIFYKYEAALRTLVDGNYEHWPIVGSYIKRNIGVNWKPEYVGTPSNFEEACLSMMPRLIYEKFVKGYTEKQWGVAANTLSSSLARRFDVREDDETRLMRHQYQGIPENGYAEFMKNIVHGIPVLLNYDFIKNRDLITHNKKLIFTGPIDEFFDYDLGKLQYRAQERNTKYFADIDYFQPCGQVNNPNLANGKHIRTLEWKYMMPEEYAEKIKGTVITTETTIFPNNPNNYEYPFPDENNITLYKKYAARAKKLDKVLICGRLGEYKYYDMDQTIARAILLAEKILNENNNITLY